MKLIVGLGNPGKDYENTRHNVGYLVVDKVFSDVVFQKKFQSLYTILEMNGEKVLIVKPETYMNLSGQAVGNFVRYYKINVEDILVIQDDLDLPFGKFRLKKNSSSGGHNGIKDIISSLGTDAFLRLKIGVGHDRALDTKDYVLGHFSKSELMELRSQSEIYDSILKNFIQKGADDTINRFNRK